MSFDRLVGLHVTDDEVYTAYREAMRPILDQYGGGFRYDFRVSDVLKSETAEPINRVFIIHFPDEASSDRFFADPAYLEARSEFYEPSVGATTILAAYDRT